MDQVVDPENSGLNDFEMPDYQKYTDEFVDKVAVATDNTAINEIYDISLNEDMETIFYDVFFEAKILLEGSESINNVINPRFYIFRDHKINAVAYGNKGFNFIAISVGLINFFCDYFNKILSIFTNTPELKHYLNQNPHDSGISEYMFKCVVKFVIYHEHAHLLQKLKRGDNNSIINFDNNIDNKDQEFDLEKHLCEGDADILATMYLYQYMKFYHDDKFKKANRATVLNIITITLSAILLYFYRTHDTFEDFYTFKKDHPHHFMRIGLIAFKFIQLMQLDRDLKYTFSRDEIIFEVNNICEHISGFDPLKIKRYRREFEREMHIYADYIDAASKRYDFLAARP